MSGQGKYTTFAPTADAKNTFLGKLFKGNSTISSPLADLVGKESDARAQTVERAKALLAPEHQQGDAGYFPNGVNMTYTGDENGTTAPDLSKVKWEHASDPANAYMPDPTSPGPGTVDPQARDTDPKIAVEDIKGQGYVPGAPGTGTKSPNKTAVAVKEHAELGVQGTMAVDVNGFG